MNGLLKRTLSGAVLVAVMVVGILHSPTALAMLATIITGGSLHEFYRLTCPERPAAKSWVDYYDPEVVGMVVVVLVYLVAWNRIPSPFLLILLPLASLFFVLAMFRKEGNSFQIVGNQLLGLIYIALPMSLLTLLGMQRGTDGEPLYNATLVLFYVILIWVNDVGAYLVGITLGKHRLCERLSPKKSWEGFFGGLIFTALAAVLLGPRMSGWENTSVGGWIIFGVVLTLSAVAGDLIESMFKRQAGVKDSGNSIPGHGGLLDRFDAMFVSLPFVYALVRLMA